MSIKEVFKKKKDRKSAKKTSRALEAGYFDTDWNEVLTLVELLGSQLQMSMEFVSGSYKKLAIEASLGKEIDEGIGLNLSAIQEDNGVYAARLKNIIAKINGRSGELKLDDMNDYHSIFVEVTEIQSDMDLTTQASQPTVEKLLA